MSHVLKLTNFSLDCNSHYSKQFVNKDSFIANVNYWKFRQSVIEGNRVTNLHLHNILVEIHTVM